MSDNSIGNRFWKKRLNKQGRKRDHIKFHASIDKNTSLSMYSREGGLYLIIKKELTEYELQIKASEAPIINQYLKSPDPFESMLADKNILENEIEPLNIGVQTTFGESKDVSLVSIKLAIGSGENDYVTIDESDLFLMDVEPTMNGILEFIRNNESVIGFCDRIFEHEKGNVILLEAKIRDPIQGISSIEFKIISSLHQRGLYLQKSMQYAGLQLYTIIKAESINNDLLEFLKSINIDWEIIFLRRDLAIEDWLEIECEKSSISLKGFLSAKFDSLGFFDINNITRIAIINQLNFKVVTKMAELLNKVKSNAQEISGTTPDSDPLKKAEIIAAANLSCAYYGIKKKIIVDKEIDPLEIQRFEAELIRM